MIKKFAYLPIILILILIDQLSKWLVIESFLRPRVFEADGASMSFFTWLTTKNDELFPPASIYITDFFNIVMVWNKGVSFGMFANSHDIMPFILSGFAAIMVVILSVWLSRAKHLMTIIPLIMIIAGAIGNVIDRLRFGAVADFLDFHLGDIHYPAFNVADCCIVVGVIILAIDGLFCEPRRNKDSAIKGE